jgi:hypothetical protein
MERKGGSRGFQRNRLQLPTKNYLDLDKKIGTQNLFSYSGKKKGYEEDFAANTELLCDGLSESDWLTVCPLLEKQRQR